MFDALTRKFQFKFKDRGSAANILGESLKDILKKEEERRNAVVLGIPRGGVITADIVAKKLSINHFDIVIPRKLTDPDNKEQSIGAIMEDGTIYLDEQLISDLQISSEYLEKEKAYQIEEIKRRSCLYQSSSNRAIKKDYNFLKDKIVILVDDGAASGATIIAAVKWIRSDEQRIPKRLIIALPIAPKDTVNFLRKECNAEVEVVTSPSSFFHQVGQYYQDFNAVSDEQVIQVMQARKILPR